MAITAYPVHVFDWLGNQEWEVEIKPSSRYYTEDEPKAGLVLRRPRPVASVRQKSI